MKVKYKNESDVSLTKGKIYDVISIEKNWYRIVDDTEEDYLFDPKATTIQKDKNYDKSKYDFWTGDVRYCRIWEVVNEKYLTRTERMQNNTEDPVFLIRDDERFIKTISSKHTIQEIADLDVPYKRIILTDNKHLKTANKLCKIIYVKNIYEHPDILVKNNLETIKTYFELL